MNNKQLGAKGELVAKNFLLKKGLKFIDQNFHSQGGEIDLIFYDNKDEEFVFVEVKTRRNEMFGDALTSITKSKLNKICFTINKFFQKNNFQNTPNFRIDVLILRIHNSRIFAEHLQNIGFDDF